MAVPTSQGISGGHPGNTTRYEMLRDSNVRDIFDSGTIPSDRSEVDGDLESLPPKYKTMQGPDDVYFSIWQAGGGYGDPLEREPERVASDVRQEYVSREEARRLYGVVIDDDGTVDQAETDSRREEIRSDRLTATKWGEGE